MSEKRTFVLTATQDADGVDLKGEITEGPKDGTDRFQIIVNAINEHVNTLCKTIENTQLLTAIQLKDEID